MLRFVVGAPSDCGNRGRQDGTAPIPIAGRSPELPLRATFAFGRRRPERRRRPEIRGLCWGVAGMEKGEGDEAGGGGRFAPLRGTPESCGSIGVCDEGENTTKIGLCQVPARIAVSRVAIGMTTREDHPLWNSQGNLRCVRQPRYFQWQLHNKRLLRPFPLIIPAQAISILDSRFRGNDEGKSGNGTVRGIGRRRGRCDGMEKKRGLAAPAGD